MMHKQTVSTTKTFKLEDLAQAAGVSPRTVRYYVQRGLLAAPQFRGRDTVYDEQHLIRLKAIRRLQDQYLPLDAIQAEIARRSARELEELADGKDEGKGEGKDEGTTVKPEPLPAPLPPPYRTPGNPRGDRWLRTELAPGIELLMSEHAALDELLLDDIRAMIERHGAAKAKEAKEAKKGR